MCEVNSRCINCMATRTMAPGLLEERGGRSVFVRQPVTDDEVVAAWRAVEVCPTAGVRIMVDAPRWSSHLADWMSERGGLNHILLTHRDDVADAERYGKHFGA